MVDLLKIEGFEWDKGNSRKNEKHGVDAAEAEQVFFDQRVLMFADEKHSQREARYQALGKTNEGRLLHVVFTLRSGGAKIRIISARPMNHKERSVYEKP
ncbi:MAG: BrnT family toxin [Nitrospiraceae bacterium]|nr:BrnT family toxin [Nitrospiraceae bacterium]